MSHHHNLNRARNIFLAAARREGCPTKSAIAYVVLADAIETAIEEPRHFDAKTYTMEWETYWIFESDWNYDLGCRTYSQRQVTRWEWLATEVVSWPEGDEEPG